MSTLNLIIHEMLRKTRQGNTTQPTERQSNTILVYSPKAERKIDASGGNSNHHMGLKPFTMPYQLSYQGSSVDWAQITYTR